MELSPARRDGVMDAMKRYSSMVYRLAYARTRNHADAEDIYQEVFLKLAFRSAWRRHVQTVEALPERASPWDGDDRYEALNRALDILPARYRAVIHLYYYEEMSVDEISAVINTKPATIRSRLARGRERLKRELTQNKEANPNA